MDTTVKMIPLSEIKGHYMFGNKGAVWSNQVHLSKSGMSTTLCGTPMLSTNWARIENIQEIGCPECIEIYNNSKH